jgi:hypothetical protein
MPQRFEERDSKAADPRLIEERDTKAADLAAARCNEKEYLTI